MSEEVKETQTEEPKETQTTEEPKETKTDEGSTKSQTTEKSEETSEENYVPQSKVDEIVTKRLERERKKFEDYDDIKTKLQEYEKQAEEKQREEMSEIERLQADLKAKEESEQSYAQQIEEIKSQVEQERIHNAFIKVATSENVQYVDDALKLADLSAVNVSEDGKVEGMEDAIKSLVENKPYLVAKKQQKPIGESANSEEQKNDKSADQLIKEAAEKAKQTGKPEDKMAYARLKRELGR